MRCIQSYIIIFFFAWDVNSCKIWIFFSVFLILHLFIFHRFSIVLCVLRRLPGPSVRYIPDISITFPLFSEACCSILCCLAHTHRGKRSNLMYFAAYGNFKEVAALQKEKKTIFMCVCMWMLLIRKGRAGAEIVREFCEILTLRKTFFRTAKHFLVYRSLKVLFFLNRIEIKQCISKNSPFCCNFFLLLLWSSFSHYLLHLIRIIQPPFGGAYCSFFSRFIFKEIGKKL